MDEIDDLLTPTSERVDGSDRDVIFHQTTKVLRNRRWRRNVVQGFAWATCFVTGGICTWAFTRPADEHAIVQRQVEEIPEKPTPTAPIDPYRNDPPERIEHWAGMAQGDRRTELYRRAGDAYLDNGDQLGALRCYRQALQSTRPDDLVVHPQQDSWLLMALKFDRQKETSDAR
ncbi:MAG: hypothetical protein ACJ8C4_14900 [Gemmataceae bacterium]